MEIELRRGVAGASAPADARGTVSVTIGERKVALKADLVSSVRTGDDVLVGGDLDQDVLHALAVKNFTRPKVAHLDYTYSILLGGLGGFLTLLGGIAAFQEGRSGTITAERISTYIAIAGIVLAIVSVRRIMRIAKVARWVHRVPATPDAAAKG